MKKLILFLTLLFVGLGATFEANAQYSPSNNLNYIKLLKTPPIGSVEDSVMVYDSSSSFVKMLPKSSIVAGKESISNKTSTVSGYDVDLYPNEKATHDALDLKLNVSDLPTNLTLYPTTTTSDVSGYVVMVKDIHDVRYNSTAVDVSTPTITGVGQLVSQRITDAGVLIGQPGVFNITTFGNIRRLSGSGTATFYFEVYHRDLAGVETLICTSSTSEPVVDGGYSEFTASGLWDDGDFVATDRIVIKSYANRIAGGSDPVYQFQFGGASPVRTLLPVPFSVVDAGYELRANKQNDLTPDGTGTKYPTVDAVNTIDLQKVVDVNGYATITGTGSKYGAFYLDETGASMFGSNSTGNNYSEVGVDNGRVIFSSQYLTKKTSITFDNAIENTTLNFPAKTVAGTYTLATTDETVNLTGDQTITGSKTFDNTQVILYGGASNPLYIQANIAGAYIENLSTNDGLKIENTSSGDAISINGTTASTGKMIKVSNNNVETFSTDKLGNVTGLSFIKTGGTSSQFLKANGSVDSNVYATDTSVVHLAGPETIIGQKTFNENINMASGKGIVSNTMSLSGSATGLDQMVLSSTITGESGRLHIEPQGYFFSGTKSKTDWMFDPYQLDQTNYRLCNLYTKDDYSLGSNGIAIFNIKSQGNDNFGMYPIFHFGFQDDGVNSQPMKIAYFDTSETSWRTNYKGAWVSTKPLVSGDFVTANFNLYQVTSSGDCGITKPSHTSGTVSDGTLSFTFVKTFNSLNIKPTVLIGDRVDMPKFGFSDVRIQFAKNKLTWHGVLDKFLDNTGANIVSTGVPSGSNSWRVATLGGMNVDFDNLNQKISIRDVSTEKISLKKDGNITATNYTGSASLTGTPTAPTATAGTNTTQIATTAFAQGIRPYKVYTALLTQVGTDAPTAIVLENTIGAIVWSRTVIGGYFATLSGAFTTDKTSVLITNGSANSTYIHGAQVSTSNVNVITLADGQIDKATIEIRVYN